MKSRKNIGLCNDAFSRSYPSFSPWIFNFVQNKGSFYSIVFCSLSLSVVLNTGNKQKLHQKSFGEKSNASATDSWCIRVLCVCSNAH